MDCVFTCPKCGYEVSWDNARESEPVCPRCSQSAPSRPNSGLKFAGGTVADWWGRVQTAQSAGDRRLAAVCILEILRLDPDLDQVAWKNLLMPDRVDMSGVPDRFISEIRAVVASMGPRAVDSAQARSQRLQLVEDVLGYVRSDA